MPIYYVIYDDPRYKAIGGAFIDIEAAHKSASKDYSYKVVMIKATLVESIKVKCPTCHR